MRSKKGCKWIAAGLLGGVLIASPAWAAKPTAEQALGLKPVQTDVEFATPTAAEMEKCEVRAETEKKAAGWSVFDPAGQPLRRFLDTNADNKLDLWCYFKDGIEVYRDIDSDFNGKADQYRWLGSAGIRWGTDTNEDGRIDHWKVISAEEVTAEIVAALRSRDAARFQRLLPTDGEVTELGLSDVRKKEVGEKIATAAKGFAELAQQQQVVTAGSRWLHFGASRPGVLPAGTDGLSKDLIAYDNVAVVVETAGKHSQIGIGSLVQVGAAWRAIDLPTNLLDNQLAASGFFLPVSQNRPVEDAAPATDGLSAESQKLVGEMETLDKSLTAATDPREISRINTQRADVLEKLMRAASTQPERDTWIRQLADTISSAVQTGGYPDGVARLVRLQETLAATPGVENHVAHVKFLTMSASYSQSLQQPEADYAKIQEKWLEDLKTFVQQNPRCESTPDALLQLAIGEEFNGKDSEAGAWYEKLVREFPESNLAAKAMGAKRRLDCVGKMISLSGPTLGGEMVSLADFRNQVIVLHYWATWCEPCKQDMQALKALQAKYATRGFKLVGVNVDGKREVAAAYVREQRLAWPQLHEAGGLDSPPANQLGILTLPTMILINRQGQVVNRNIHISDLEAELAKLLP